MGQREFKLGFSEIGGIFIGRDIQSDFHKHYAITVLISLDKEFNIIMPNQDSSAYKAVIIQKNINFRLESSKGGYIAFVHIAPYSEAGIKLSNNETAIQSVSISLLKGVLKI